MYHGTDSRAAQLIACSQRFRPSVGGMLGDGVYVTRTRQKAEGYRIHHPNSTSSRHNLVRPAGQPDPGAEPSRPPKFRGDWNFPVHHLFLSSCS